MAVQDCSGGGARGERAEEEGLLSVVAFEVGRRPAVSKLQIGRKKGNIFPSTITTFFSIVTR